MRILLVLAHPLTDSFAAGVAATAKAALEKSGHSVDLLDLYREGFDPRLQEQERRGYFDTPYDTAGVDEIVARLRAADGLILVFPHGGSIFRRSSRVSSTGCLRRASPSTTSNPAAASFHA